jgi:hypothetical protein
MWNFAVKSDKGLITALFVITYNMAGSWLTRQQQLATLPLFQTICTEILSSQVQKGEGLVLQNGLSNTIL